MIKRYGDAPITGQKYKLRPGAYAILPRDGKVLVTYQAAPHEEFQLPGGGIDPGEGPIAALHREVYEETGFRIGSPRKLGVFRRFVFMPDYDMFAEKVCHIYLARPILPLGPPTEPGHMAVWLDPVVALAELSNDGDADFLAGVF
ncbi:8-oxo-dGTP diphosphatase [Loktanella ponticola]|uniref:8-oxo-dGTP diphosphatase n=1 Tax=Yoonia ponticola TaxID=1524255 RepID=A0A7W9BIS4_9RHOB|nr:NUDIX hydrolase [Yoonia ponticola]MBB5721333.1 8-oxo-dGTP diphosphatase [Yoonia ponticola]